MSFLVDANWKSLVTRLNDSGVEVWRTKDEIAFLVNLGTHATFMTQRTVPDRKTLLRRYIKAARQRKVWDEIDREACLEMAATLLVDEEKT
jgi:hypothetical protein